MFIWKSHVGSAGFEPRMPRDEHDSQALFEWATPSSLRKWLCFRARTSIPGTEFKIFSRLFNADNFSFLMLRTYINTQIFLTMCNIKPTLGRTCNLSYYIGLWLSYIAKPCTSLLHSGRESVCIIGYKPSWQQKSQQTDLRCHKTLNKCWFDVGLVTAEVPISLCCQDDYVGLYMLSTITLTSFLVPLILQKIQGFSRPKNRYSDFTAFECLKKKLPLKPLC